MNWQARSPKPEQHSLFPIPLAAVIAKIRHTAILIILETKSFSQLSVLPDSFGFLRRTGLLLCHGHNLLLSSYLCRIKRKGNYSSFSACRHHLQHLTHLLLDCPASEPLRRAIFSTTSSILTSGPDLGAWPDCMGLRKVPT